MNTYETIVNDILMNYELGRDDNWRVDTTPETIYTLPDQVLDSLGCCMVVGTSNDLEYLLDVKVQDPRVGKLTFYPTLTEGYEITKL